MAGIGVTLGLTFLFPDHSGVIGRVLGQISTNALTGSSFSFSNPGMKKTPLWGPCIS